MAVLKVKKATIVVERSLQPKLVEALQAFGGFEITDLRAADEPAAGSGPERASAEQIDERAKERVKQALAILGRYEKPRSGIVETFVDVKYALTLKEYRELTGRDYLATVERVESLDAELTALREERKRLEAQAGALAPLRSLLLPLEEIRTTRRCTLLVGALPANELAALADELAAIGEAHHEVIGEGGRSIYLLVAHLSDDPRVPQALATHGFVPATFPGLSGTAAHNLARIERRLAEIDRRIADCESEFTAMAAEDLALKAVHDGFVAAEQRAAAAEQAIETPHLVVLEGWVSAKKADGLAQTVRGAVPDAAVLLADPAEGDNPPTILENPPLVEPFEMVTQIYGAPNYREMDPTPWLAPFFAVFFGTALGDAGYGLLMAIFFLVGMRKWYHLTWSGKRMNRLMIIIGLASVVMGILTGSFFGDLTRYLPFPALDRLRTRFMLIDPMANPLAMMGVALAMGVIQVYTGIIVKFVAVIRGGSWKDALLDQGMWLLYFGGFILYGIATVGYLPAVLAPVFKGVGLAGVLGILLFAGRANRNPLARLGIGLYGLYGTINYVADVLSYSRLLALGLSGSVIAVVVNQLGFMAGAAPIVGIPIIIAVLAFGHLFNIAISAFGAFIHCARLQFVEYFSKFYEGGGRYLEPLRWKGKYTLIREYTE